MNDGYLPCLFYSSFLHAVLQRHRELKEPTLPPPQPNDLPGQVCSGVGRAEVSTFQLSTSKHQRTFLWGGTNPDKR